MNVTEAPPGTWKLRTKICVVLGLLYAIGLGVGWIWRGGFLLLWPYAAVLLVYIRGDASSDTWGKVATALGVLVPIVFLYFSPILFLYSLPLAVVSVAITLNARNTVPLLGVLDFGADAGGSADRGSTRAVIEFCFEIFETDDYTSLLHQHYVKRAKHVGDLMISVDLLERSMARGGLKRFSDSLYEVSISAKSLTWPNVCSCCLSPSNTVRTVSHSHEKGVEVVRTTTRTWDVPYCTICADHVDAMSNALAKHRELLDRVGNCRALIAFAAMAACAVFALHGGSGSTWAGILSRGPAPGLGEPLFFLLILIAPLLMCLWAFRWWENCVTDYPPTAELAVAAVDGCKDGCSSAFEAVEYAGWHDTWSDLRFRSKGYLSLFLSANDKKRRGRVKTIEGEDFGDDQADGNIQYGGGYQT